MKKILFFVSALISLASFAQWNNPHIGNSDNNTLYSTFQNSPKTLDPAEAYTTDATGIIAQIYEPPLQYNFFKRPYTLEPLTLTQMPTVTTIKKNGQVLFTIYHLKIKSGIYYQPHPAFAQNSADDIANARQLSDLKNVGTRELIADDYVYEIKRLASPTVHSPILGVMSQYIVGMSDYASMLEKVYQKKGVIDLRQFPLLGVKSIGRYEYEIMIHGDYSQFLYWLAMPFFAPIPWEADRFYATPGFSQYNITMDWYPIGTGPYLLSKNNPNDKMVLIKNPNFRGELFPVDHNHPTDMKAGRMPFIDKVVFSLEKETIPRWNKFLQGYYDRSGISADSFNQVIRLNDKGKPELTPGMKNKGIHLETSVAPSMYYLGFNMLDEVVGGNSEQHRKLRKAIAIAVDFREFIEIFMNGRGIVANGPIPPGIFGYQPDSSPLEDTTEKAKQLLREAGYPDGINPKTHHPLILNYDVTSSGNPDDAMEMNWMRKQFSKLGIDLVIRQTDYNRFQDKIRTGQAQIFWLGWVADYPDPENFLFLFSSHNGKVKYGGENSVNYSNPRFDQLFSEMKNLKDTPERLHKISEMIAILRNDTPCDFAIYPISFTLSQQWVDPLKPNAVANNTLKYESINPPVRTKLQEKWNKPILWPVIAMIGLLVMILLPLGWVYYRRESKPSVKRSDH